MTTLTAIRLSVREEAIDLRLMALPQGLTLIVSAAARAFATHKNILCFLGRSGPSGAQIDLSTPGFETAPPLVLRRPDRHEINALGMPTELSACYRFRKPVRSCSVFEYLKCCGPRGWWNSEDRKGLNDRDFSQAVEAMLALCAAADAGLLAEDVKKRPAAPVYTAADAAETEYLCRLSGAPHLARAFISRSTPLSTVRASLAKRGLELAAAEQVKRRQRLEAQRRRIAADWTEIVEKIK
jgi:hypothetical protein